MEITLTLDPAQQEAALARGRRRQMVLWLVAMVVFGLLTRQIFASFGVRLEPWLFAFDLCLAGALFYWATLAQSRRQSGWLFSRLRIHLDPTGVEKEFGVRPGTRMAWNEVTSVHVSPERGWLLRSQSGALLRVPAEITPVEPWRERVAQLPQQSWSARDSRDALVETKRAVGALRAELRAQGARGILLGGVALMLVVNFAAIYFTSPA